MTTPDELSLLDLFANLLPPKRWRELEGKKRPEQLYSLPVVVAMMMLQRLDERGTQQQVVQKLALGKLNRVISSKPVWKETISCNTGGYARACGRLKPKLVEQVSDEILLKLAEQVETISEGQRPVYVVDGTSLSLEHTPRVLAQYPPSRNQFGELHWGKVRLVGFHDVHTGIALRPAWGAMFGPNAVSEQYLAQQALERTPPGSVILGDGNFGIFAFAYQVDQSQRKLVLRLTAQRARSLGATKLLPEGERRIEWHATAADRKGRPEVPKQAQIQGRLIAVSRNGYRQPLYLFTTLEEAREAVVALYAQRWNMELDLRTLKRTLHLDHLRGKSREAADKELLIAIVAYGLVRVFMALAARRAQVPPRRISFTRAYGLLDIMIGQLCSPHAEEREQSLDRLLRYMAQAKLPNRSKPRAYPRAIWGPKPSFPSRVTAKRKAQDCK
jgi:putative transposase